MTPIDFEKKFKAHLLAWSEKNLTGEEEEDEAEQRELEEYERWLNAPKSWLDGQSPRGYFEALKDVGEAIKLFAEYAFAGMNIPALLINRVIEMKEEVYPALLFVLGSGDVAGRAAAGMKAKIVSLITEMEKPHPYGLYIGWIRDSKEKNELSEAAAEALAEADAEQKEHLLDAYQNAGSIYAAECFADILSNYPGDPRIVDLVIDRFVASPDKKAFYANCLGKLGDAGALQYLYEALEDPELGYYDYAAVKYAIEELGGFVDIDRDFTGDPDFEKLKNL